MVAKEFSMFAPILKWEIDKTYVNFTLAYFA